MTLRLQTLENIHFGVNAFKDKGTLALLDSLKRHPRLHTVDLSANCMLFSSVSRDAIFDSFITADITDEAAIGLLSTALERKWKALWIGGNQLSDKLIQQLEGIVKDSPLVLDVLEHARRVNPANMAYGIATRQTQCKS